MRWVEEQARQTPGGDGLRAQWWEDAYAPGRTSAISRQGTASSGTFFTHPLRNPGELPLHATLAALPPGRGLAGQLGRLFQKVKGHVDH